MIEKIGLEKYRFISSPSVHFIDIIKLYKDKYANTKLTIAEIGVGIGATTIEALKLLKSCDTYYIFDFQEIVDELFEDIKNCNINIVKIGNSHKLYDSYAWNLCQLYLKHESAIFNIVYLDGSHSYIFDAPACCILKELIIVQGYLILDDFNWTFASSPTCNPQNNPSILEKYTNEQIQIPHIELISKCFLDTDKRFKKIVNTKLNNRRCIYQKISE